MGDVTALRHSLSLRMGDVKHAVTWYGHATEECIRVLYLQTLGLPKNANILCTDQDGIVVTLCAALPAKLTIDVKLISSDQSTSNILRKQAVKFENVQAHLANERTWLAWVRTALSSLSISFSLLALLRDSKAPWLGVSLFSLGGSFVAAVFTTFIAGWFRYTRIRHFLVLAKRKLPYRLHRVGLSISPVTFFSSFYF